MDFEKFNPSLVDQKWQKFWEEKKYLNALRLKKSLSIIA